MRSNDRLLPLAEAFSLCGLGKTTGYRLIGQNLLPQPVRVSARRVCIPQSELDAVLRARCAGYSESDIRSLVISLHAERLAEAEALMGKPE